MVSKDDVKIQFDQVINTKTGFILGAKLETQIKAAANLATPAETVKARELHCKLGHVSEDATRRRAKF